MEMIVIVFGGIIGAAIAVLGTSVNRLTKSVDGLRDEVRQIKEKMQ